METKQQFFRRELAISLFISSLYFLGVLLLPPICCAGVFFILALIEGTALPWLTLLFGPALSLTAVGGVALYLFFQNMKMVTKAKYLFNAVLISSLVWAPLLAKSILFYALENWEEFL